MNAENWYWGEILEVLWKERRIISVGIQCIGGWRFLKFLQECWYANVYECYLNERDGMMSASCGFEPVLVCL